MNGYAKISLCSGNGQYHSEANTKAPKPYSEIALEQITAMLEHPQAVDKQQAQWAIFSTLKTRVANLQRSEGRFYCLWADIDENPQPILSVAKKVAEALSADVYAYTSKSATQENQKGRLIIPLAVLVYGDDFELLQHILNNKLESLGIIPDRATERANQICYLPNRGAFYQHLSITDYGRLDALTFFATEITQEIELKNAEAIDREARTEQARLKATERMATGTKSPVDAFNAAYDVGLMFDTFGYLKRGNRWVSPNSESGSAGVTLSSDSKKWISSHGSDAALNIGQKKDANCWGDAFDLFTHYQHRGDRNAAIKAAGDMFTVNGATITKSNQRAHMEAQGALSVNGFDAMPEGVTPTPPKTFRDFSIRGDSVKMRTQMLADKYVLGELAILGQMTVIYAKPNSGKTLLTLWLLIDGIKRNEIDAHNVFYINADDNFKGLVCKTELAEQHGFEIIAPAHKDFKAADFLSYLEQMIKHNDARGKIIILDTLKKFTDIMDKKVGSEFGRVARAFVSNGGTIIMLAHTNKNRDSEGKVIFSGTSDIVDDVDCAYTLDITNDDGGTRTALFENIKARGDVAREAAYSYTSKDSDYQALLASVSPVNATEKVKELQAISATLAKNAEAIEAITEAIQDGITKKTELINTASDNACLSLQKIKKTLKEHTGTDYLLGHRWQQVKGDKAAKEYKLIAPFSFEVTTPSDYEAATEGV